MNFSFKSLKRQPVPRKQKSSGLYHDIYDFSYLPFSYGDTITWSVLSAVRCLKANRQGVHIHLVCDVKASGCSILTNVDNATELYMLELLPAFTSCPLFSGLTLHSSRAAFDEYWSNLSATDSLAAQTYAEHLEIYAKRESYPEVLEYFYSKCSRHKEIDEWSAATSDPLHLRLMPECVMDAEALQAAYPANTFWVALHCRLLRLDESLKASRPGTDMTRDGNFVQWYNFIDRSAKQHPHVRFILLGRLQEKPLALLRLPNVVTPRALGMTMGHEIALVNRSHVFMGSLSGPAQIAFFSPVAYAMFSCTKDGCKNLGIPFGQPQVPHATPRQRLYYGPETSELLSQVLAEHLMASNAVAGSSRQSTTNRFFISEAQKESELFLLLRPYLKALLIKFGAIEDPANSATVLQEIRSELSTLEESFPQDIIQLPEYLLLQDLLGMEHQLSPTHATHVAAKSRRDSLLAQLSQSIDVRALVRTGKLNHFALPLSGCTGLEVDGLCSQLTKLQLGFSTAGSFLILNWIGTASGQPVEVEIQVADETPIRKVLSPGSSQSQIPIERDHARTPVFLRFASAREWTAQDPRICSACLESAILVTCSQRLVREPSGLFPPIAGGGGIRADGWCNESARLSLGASRPGDTLTLEWQATASGKTTGLEIRLAGEEPVQITLPHAPFRHQILLTRARASTDIALRFASSNKLGPQDSYIASARLLSVQIESSAS